MSRHLSPAPCWRCSCHCPGRRPSIIISSNHQVAADTIAGASAPRGDNTNMIAGWVGTSDLHNATLGISKLDLPQIAFSGPGADPDDFAPHHTAVSLDGVTLGVSCIFSSTPTATTRLALLLEYTAGGRHPARRLR